MNNQSRSRADSANWRRSANDSHSTSSQQSSPYSASSSSSSNIPHSKPSSPQRPIGSASILTPSYHYQSLGLSVSPRQRDESTPSPRDPTVNSQSSFSHYNLNVHQPFNLLPLDLQGPSFGRDTGLPSPSTGLSFSSPTAASDFAPTPSHRSSLDSLIGYDHPPYFPQHHGPSHHQFDMLPPAPASHFPSRYETRTLTEQYSPSSRSQFTPNMSARPLHPLRSQPLPMATTVTTTHATLSSTQASSGPVDSKMGRDLADVLASYNGNIPRVPPGTTIYVGSAGALPNRFRDQQNFKYYVRSMDGVFCEGGFWSVPNIYSEFIVDLMKEHKIVTDIMPANPRTQSKWTLYRAPTYMKGEDAYAHMVRLGKLLAAWRDDFVSSGRLAEFSRRLRDETEFNAHVYSDENAAFNQTSFKSGGGYPGMPRDAASAPKYKKAQDFDTLLTRNRTDAMSEFWPGSKIWVAQGMKFPAQYEDQQHIHYYHYPISGEFCWSVPTIYKRYIDRYLQAHNIEFRHIAIGPKYTSYAPPASVRLSKYVLFDLGEKLVEWRNVFLETNGLASLISALAHRDPLPEWYPPAPANSNRISPTLQALQMREITFPTMMFSSSAVIHDDLAGEPEPEGFQRPSLSRNCSAEVELERQFQSMGFGDSGFAN